MAEEKILTLQKHGRDLTPLVVRAVARGTCTPTALRGTSHRPDVLTPDELSDRQTM